ncbi:hypothetical protein K457DRAFT_26118 [Linnemannia elongata AG-77]|uniref:Uncharacterized protein n=1 Tax=Linnemannia elongata AG-77 TaxID=1314771 RepID=A0A197JBI7_9FUNG|nr:hypothetical protein K457DRAFT_26118 [Linnemannia elongata AG-77]
MLLSNAVTNVVIVVLSINTTLLLTSIASIIAYATSKPLFVEVPTAGIPTLLHISKKYEDRKTFKWGLLGYAVLFMVSTHLCTLLVPIFHPVKPMYLANDTPEFFPVFRQFDTSTGRNAFTSRDDIHVLEAVAKDYCNLLSNCSIGESAGLKPVSLVRLSDIPPKCSDFNMQNNLWSEYCLGPQTNTAKDDLYILYSPATNASYDGGHKGDDLTPPICTVSKNFTESCDYTTKYNISGKFNTTHNFQTSVFYNLPAWTFIYPDDLDSYRPLYRTIDRLSSISLFGISGIDNPTATQSPGWYIGNYVDVMHGSSNTSYVYSVTIDRLVFDITDPAINITDVSSMVGHDILPFVKNLNSTYFDPTGSVYDTILTYNVSVDTNQMSGKAFFQVASAVNNFPRNCTRFMVIDTWNSSVITYASYTSWDKFDWASDYPNGAYVGRPVNGRVFVQPVMALWMRAGFPQSSSTYTAFIPKFSNWTTITDEAASLIIPLTTPSRTNGTVLGSSGYGQYGTTYKEVIASTWTVFEICIIAIYCVMNIMLMVYVRFYIPEHCRTPLWTTAAKTNTSDKFDLNFVTLADGDDVALMSNNMVITTTASGYNLLPKSEYLLQRGAT